MTSEFRGDAVLCTGRIYCDLIFSGIPSLPSMGKEVFAGNMQPTLGGGAFITGAHLARLNRHTALVSCFGTDPLSQGMETIINKTALDLQFLERHADAGPQVTVVMSGSEDRAFLSCRAGHAFPNTLDAALAWSKAGLLHIAEYATLHEDPGVLGRAKAAGLKISLDPSWDDTLILDKTMLSYGKDIDLFLPNETEALTISGKTDVSEALEFLTQYFPRIVIKCGAEGALASWDGEIYKVAAPKVEVVDTTGAGDAFNSGFIHTWMNGGTIEQCLENAIAVGSEVVQVVGGAGEANPAR